MRKETISMGQAISLITLFTLGVTATLGAGREATNNAWLSIVLAILAFIPVICIYIKLLSSFPGKNIFEILILVCGKLWGKLLILMYSWYALNLGSIVIRIFGEFIHSVALPETPDFVSYMSMGMMAIWMCRAGIEVMARSAKLMLIVVITVLFLANIPTVIQLRMENLKPFLGDGIQPVLKSSFSVFSFPFAESIILTGAVYSLDRKGALKKSYFGGMVFSGILILILSVRNILLLGNVFSGLHYFPSYAAISLIKIGDFVQRIEGFVDIVLQTCAYFKICICLYVSSKGFSHLFNYPDYKIFVLPLGIIMIFMAQINFVNIMELMNFITNIYPIYAFPFQVIFPLIFLIVYLVRKKAGKLHEASKE